MPQGQREKKPKTSVCYFLIGALAPDTAESWSDARMVIWRIPLVFMALRAPLHRKYDMSQPGQRSKRSSCGCCDQALQLAAVREHMTYWTSQSFFLGKMYALAQGGAAGKHQWNTYMCKAITQILDALLFSSMPDCHVHQHPPPTNSLIWPPPPMAAATSLMPNRPALGLLSEGEGTHAWIPQSNLNM